MKISRTLTAPPDRRLRGRRDRLGPPIREFEGTVVSVNRGSRTFRLNDSERGTKRIRITRNTRFERINGFSGLRAGMRNIEAT